MPIGTSSIVWEEANGDRPCEEKPLFPGNAKIMPASIRHHKGSLLYRPGKYLIVRLIFVPTSFLLALQAVETRISSHRDLNIAHGGKIASFPLH